MLVEALRSAACRDAQPGLLRGLDDKRLAPVLKQMHERIDRRLSVKQLAKTAALSRSAFFLRFTQQVGVAPKEYLLSWRMEIAKDLLRQDDLTISEIADRVGYKSASAFSLAFRKHVGTSPSRFGRRD